MSDPVHYMDGVNVNYFMTVLCEIIYDTYKQFAPKNDPINSVKKETWISDHIVDKYFKQYKTNII